MHRPYGYSPRGQICPGQYDWHPARRTNVLGAWWLGKLLAPLALERTVNAGVFMSWIRDHLLPVLPRSSVLILDNASFHRDQRLIPLLEAAGHRVLWLPPYSPDLDPIEQVWAWMKRMRREWMIDLIPHLIEAFNQICINN